MLLIPVTCVAGIIDFAGYANKITGGTVCKPSAPTLVVTPATYAFGNVSSTKTRTTNIALSNTGNATLTGITFGAFSSAVFAHSSSASAPCGTTLAAKATCNRKISFTPAAVASYTGTLVIDSDQLAVKTVPITGAGTGTTYLFASNWNAATNPVDGGPDTWTSETDTGSLLSVNSGELLFNHTALTAGYLLKTLAADHTSAILTGDIKFSSTTVGGNSTYTIPLKIADNSENGIAEARFYANAGGTLANVYLRYWNGSSEVLTSAYAFVPTPNVANTVALKILTSASGTGYAKLFIDGTERLSATGLTNNQRLPRKIYAGNRTSTYTTTNITIRYDNVTFAEIP